jgi:peptidoglycan/LPS O-acetylase OafA/YrhL
MHGDDAVRMFFIISGFLIAFILNADTYSSPRSFWINRFLRIYPLYWIVAGATLTTLLLEHWRSAVNGFFHLPASAQAALALANIVIFGQDVIMFTGIRDDSLAFVFNFRQSSPQLWTFLLVPPAWSLGLELTFYAIAPFIVTKVRALLGLFVVSIILKGASIHFGLGKTDPWSYRFFPFELSMFLLGALSQRYLLPFAERHSSQKIASIPLPLVVTAGTLAAVLFYRWLPGGKYQSIWSAVGFAAFLPFLFLQSKSAFDRRIGELSYPIYVVHWSIVTLFVKGLTSNVTIKTAISILGSVTAAWVLNKTILKPIERMRTKLRDGSDKVAGRDNLGRPFGLRSALTE